MNSFRFIRPSGGFRIIIEERPRDYIRAECSENPRVALYWEALLERLKMTALREGYEVTDGWWTFLAEGAPKLGVPSIQVLFTHDQTSLTITAAMVWQPGDLDPDEIE